MISHRESHLHDELQDDLKREFELLADVVAATTMSPGRLSLREVDEVLGVTRVEGQNLPHQRQQASSD